MLRLATVLFDRGVMGVGFADRQLQSTFLDAGNSYMCIPNANQETVTSLTGMRNRHPMLSQR